MGLRHVGYEVVVSSIPPLYPAPLSRLWACGAESRVDRKNHALSIRGEASLEFFVRQGSE